ncbi:MAG: hypothetical protein ACQETL_15050 [Bacteroidota bacterium]
MFRNAFVFLCFISLLACHYDSSNTSSQKVESKFILKDSIVVDYIGNLHITDFDEDSDSYLALDLSSNSILQFNTEGDIIYEPIQSGEGPDYVTGTIYSLGYSGNESLFAQTRTTLYELNYEGEILRKIKLPDGTIYINMRLVNYVFDNKVFLLHDNNTDLSPSFKEYYQEAKHITIVDLEVEEVTVEVPFEKTSNYLNNEYYYRNSVASFTVNKLDSILNVIYPYEHKIFQYDLTGNYELIGVIETNPENFKEPEKTLFDTKIDIMKSLAYDSYYLNVFNNKEYLILEYITGIPKTISPPESMPELNELFRLYNNRYYQIFKNGEKIGSDIEKPEGVMDLKYLHENNHVVFQLDINNAERNYEVFYLYEIDF